MAPSSASSKKIDKGKGKDTALYGSTSSGTARDGEAMITPVDRSGEEEQGSTTVDAHAAAANGDHHHDERTPLIKDRRRAAKRATPQSTGAGRSSWISKHLLTILIVLATLLLAIILFLALLIGSFVPDDAERGRLMDLAGAGANSSSGAIRWPTTGPIDRIEVINVTDAKTTTNLKKDDDDNDNGSIWVRVESRIALDTDALLGIRRSASRRRKPSWWHADEDDEDAESRLLEHGRGYGARWWEHLRTRVGDWMLRRLSSKGEQEVVVEIPKEVEVELWETSSRHLDLAATLRHHHGQLLTAHLPEPLRIPFEVNSDSNHQPRFHKINSLIQLHPPRIASSDDAAELLAFAQRVFREGRVGVQVRTGKVDVRLATALGADVTRVKEHYIRPTSAWWSKFAKAAMRDLRVETVVQLPELPDVPGNRSISDLVQVRDYSIRTVKSPTGNTSAPTIMLSARATALNPLLARNSSSSTFPFDFHLDWPYDLPFEVLLPDGDRHAPLARVVTRPVSLDARHQSSIAVRIDGEVDRNLGGASERALSRFLQNYLHGKDNEVIVRGLASVPHSLCNATSTAPTPSWILRALPAINATVAFPSPPDELDLIRSVTIENMRISQADGRFMASGIVKAVVELPKEMRGLHADVTAALPDILVFNGATADKREIDPDQEPYPPKAFGHIHPPKWLSATSETQGDLIMVTAPIQDQPLDVIPGRDSELSDFVTKIVFRGSALAGIKGRAGVKIRLAGVDSEIAVQGLPVVGEVVVGRPKL